MNTCQKVAHKPNQPTNPPPLGNTERMCFFSRKENSFLTKIPNSQQKNSNYWKTKLLNILNRSADVNSRHKQAMATTRMRRRTLEWCRQGGTIHSAFADTDTVGSITTLPASFSLFISLWYTLWYTQSHPSEQGGFWLGLGGFR